MIRPTGDHMNNQENNNQPNFLQGFISFLGVFVILAGQILLLSNPVDESITYPKYLWISGVGVFIFVFGQLFRFQSTSNRFHLRSFSEKNLWILISILFSIATTLANATFLVFSRLYAIPVITLWLLGAASFVYAYLKGNFALDSLKNWFTVNKKEILVVIAITILAASLRFYRLGELPRVIDGDEGRVGSAAEMTASGPTANPFALWENFGGIYLQAINFALTIFGASSFSLRLMPAIGGILAIPATYLLARQFGGPKIAIMASTFMAISHTHIHFSRISSVAYIQDIWLAPLELYFLISGIQKQKSWRTALGGVLLAFHFSVYLSAQIFASLIIAFLIISAILYGKWLRPAAKQVGVFWLGFLIVAMSQIYYNIKQPENFLNRLNSDGTFQTTWLADTMQATGKSIVELLFERVVHAFLSIIYHPSFDFYGTNSPILSTVTATLFLVGLGLALWRIKNPVYLLLNGYFWACTLSIGIFALPPSADTYRMIITLPAVFIMCAIGLDKILEQVNITWETTRYPYAISVFAILGSLLVANYWMYYGDFLERCRFGGDQLSRFASYLGSYTRTIGRESNIYLLSDEIYIAGTHSSTFFLNRNRPIINFAEPLDQLTPISGEIIIANPNRIEELETWIRAHPGGQSNYIFDCQNPMMMSYIVP
jgi:hypothetical protein